MKRLCVGDGFCLFVCIPFSMKEVNLKNSELQMCYSFIKLLQCFIFFEAPRFLLA